LVQVNRQSANDKRAADAQTMNDDVLAQVNDDGQLMIYIYTAIT